MDIVGCFYSLLWSFIVCFASYILYTTMWGADKCDGMSATKRSIALVVKRTGGDRSCLLLIVDKKWTVGIFQPPVLPAVGSVITIGWRQHCQANTICVEKWEKYTGYEPMGGFDVNNTENEFTGMFYTTGCVRYNGVPLENPAIFNNYIGIVNDRSKILDEFYVGKLRATVTFVREGEDYCWMLLKVVDYLKKEGSKESNCPRKYKGIVGAVNQGPRQDGHYITSRFFPHDVRWFGAANGAEQNAKSLLGREVSFAARKGISKDTVAYYVEGGVAPVESDLRTIYNGTFFSIDIVVEYVGCTDEQQRVIVWSDQWEVVLDRHSLFKVRDFGLYRVHAVRHFEPRSFPRWKVTRIRELVKNFGTGKMSSPASLFTSPLRVPPSNANSGGRKHVGQNLRNISVNEVPSKKLGEMFISGPSPTAIKKGGVGPINSQKAENTTTRQLQHCSEDEDLEKKLRIYIHRCLESSDVRAAIKKADPEYFKCLIDALMND